MSMIPDEIVEQVRDSADLVGIIGEAVELKRTGSDYRGPCPFHGGTHRNFSVIPKKGRYYCFVCHESGDVFSWLMKRLGMDYPTAVREVARRVGIVIPERAARAGPDPLEPLFGAVAVAQDWFTRQLLESAEAKGARDYLEGREISLDTAALYGLGYAPPGKAFLAAMTELGLETRVLLDAGVAATRDDGSIVPRFRSRLLFPIHDLRGRACGFGGRLLGPGEPKYLNSPENQIFHKGRQLYNLHQAKGAIRKEETVILVEGYFDVLRLVLAGIEHVVAPLGTSLTSDQATLLRRFAPAAILLYDSDQAGLRATFRAGDELLRHSVRVRVATMPAGEDPDTLVRRGGAAALEPILGDAIDLLERKVQLLEQKGWFEGVDHQREALDRLLPTLRAAADPITRDLYVKEVSERTGVTREVLLQQVTARPDPAYARVPEGRTRSSSDGPGARDDIPSPDGRDSAGRPVRRAGTGAPGRRGRARAAARAHAGARLARPRGDRGAARVVRDHGASRGVRGVAPQSRKRRVPDILGTVVSGRPSRVGVARQHRGEVRRAGSGPDLCGRVPDAGSAATPPAARRAQPRDPRARAGDDVRRFRRARAGARPVEPGDRHAVPRGNVETLHAKRRRRCTLTW